MSAQNRHTILTQDWFNLESSELHSSIEILLETHLELHKSDMNKEVQVLFEKNTEGEGEFRKYLFNNMNDDAMPGFLTKFCEFSSLLVLVDDGSKKNTLLALFPPTDRVDYQCVSGTGERLQNIGLKSLYRALTNQSDDSPLAEHMTNTLANEFDAYIEKQIIASNLLKRVPPSSQVHLTSCLSYLVGVHKKNIKDVYYSTPMANIQSRSAFHMLNNFEKKPCAISFVYVRVKQGVIIFMMILTTVKF